MLKYKTIIKFGGKRITSHLIPFFFQDVLIKHVINYSMVSQVSFLLRIPQQN